MIRHAPAEGSAKAGAGVYLRTGVKVLAALVVILGPPMALAAWLWPPALSILSFGAVVAIIAAIGRGFSSGLKFGAIFAVAATLGSWATDSPIFAALIVAAMSALIAAFATKGLAGPMMVAALLTPYVIHSPPDQLLADGSSLAEPLYLAATFVSLLASAAYAAFVASRIIPSPRQSNTKQVATISQALLYGTVLAATTGIITFVSMTWYREDLWMWLLLTIYILTKPTLNLDYQMIFERLAGTVVGSVFAVVLVVVIPGEAVFYVLGVGLIATALVLKVLKKSYWVYASCLTPAVIFLDSAGNDRIEVADQRLILTLLGVVVALVIGVGTNLLVRWYAKYEARHAQAIDAGSS